MKDHSPPSPDDSADFELDLDQIFARKAEKPVQQPAVPASGAVETEAKAVPERDRAVDSGESRRRVAKFEKRGGEGSKNFTRLVARPSVAVAAAPPPDTAEASRDGEVFVKRRPLERIPELKENKAHSFLLNIFEASPLAWLDPAKFNRFLRVAGIVALLALLVYMVMKFSGTMTGAGVNTAGGTQLTKEGVEARLEAARNTMIAFLGAKTWEEKLPYVLEPERVKPLMQEWYEVEKSQDPGVDTAETFRPKEIGGRYWFAFSLKTPSGLPVQMRLQEIPTADGTPSYKIDWENFVALGAMPWEKFCQERPGEAKQMNVYLAKSDNYAAPYDREKFLCFATTHQSGPPALTAFVEKTNRAAQELERTVAAGNGALVPANLYLKFDKDAAAGQVRVVDLVADWVRY